MRSLVFIKNKYLLITAAFLIFILIYRSVEINVAKKTNAEVKYDVVIDPGHGGTDPGYVSPNGVAEDNINLNIAKKLYKLLNRRGLRAILTRANGKTLTNGENAKSLKGRSDIANASGAKVFISIHLNSFPDSQYYGAQTFYQRDSEKGKKLAQTLQKALVNELDKKNFRKPLPTDNLSVLRHTKIPAVIVECGFLSNPAEEKRLMDDAYQSRIALAIYNGIEEYLKSPGK